ncbi:hypothetical protein AB0L53_48815 [Nonomuraea sp. NPDC052129]|uniref:hypothetical protein n=1 Tax=Nonomuraea sp. NPDC052129 TaxID=3154651 RepID=UPI0034402800
MLGDAWLWAAVEWSPPAYAEFYMRGGFDTPTTVVLLVAALVKAVLLWLILRAPAPGPLNRRAKALRRLLYLAVAYSLVLWFPIALLPDAVNNVIWIVARPRLTSGHSRCLRLNPRPSAPAIAPGLVFFQLQ